MRLAGYDSYVTTKCGNPEWDCPIFPGGIKTDDIVVYPESIKLANPLKARNIVRYMLYLPKAYFGGGMVPANEYCMPYHELFFDECVLHYAGVLSKDNILCIPSIESGLMCSTKEKTIDAIYYIGKANGKHPSFLVPKDAIEVTRHWPPTRAEVAELLQKTKNLYSFDHHTALNDEAKLCGCNVWLMDGPKQPVRYETIAGLMDDGEDSVLVGNAAKRIVGFFERSI